jgi:HK97 family phage prohead protease
MEAGAKFFHRQASFKVLDESERLIEGWANTNKVDRDNEIFDYTEMKAALEDFLKNPMMFLQHDTWGESIGKWLLAEVKDSGLWASGQVSKVGELANRVWEKILAKELQGLSVGFLKTAAFQRTPVIVDGQAATLLKGYKIFEISLVYLPANPDSIFTLAGKSYRSERESIITVMEDYSMAGIADKTTDEKKTTEAKTLAEAQEANKKAGEQMAQEKAKLEGEAKAMKEQLETQAKALANLQAQVKAASQPIQKAQAPQDQEKGEEDVATEPEVSWKGYNPSLSVKQNFSNYRMEKNKKQ